MKIQFFTATDKGQVRTANEDAFGVSEKDNLCIVCDGMGGGVAGELASKIATETIIEHITNKNDKKFQPLKHYYDKDLPENAVCLAEAIQLANRTIFNLPLKYPGLRGMGTTVCSALFEPGAAYVAHVGDSRVYQFSYNHLQPITKDHSFVMELLEDKEISLKEADRFKQKNIITKALGVNPYCDLDLKIVPIERVIKYLLLCTDGLWGVVNVEEIEEVLQKYDATPHVIPNVLLEKANNHGGPDNITLVLAKVIDPGIRKPTLTKYFAKVYSIINKDKSFYKIQDKLVSKNVNKYKALVPQKVKNAYNKNLLKNLTMYSLIALTLVGGLFFINTKIKLTKIMNMISPEPLYSIKIDNYVIGTKVSLFSDNNLIQEGEYSLLQNLKVGAYKLLLQKEGFDNKTVKVMLTNLSQSIDGTLNPLSNLELHAKGFIEDKYPIDARVFLDDVETDVTISKVIYGNISLPVPNGNHQISIGRGGKVYYRRLVTIRPGKNRIDIE